MVGGAADGVGEDAVIFADAGDVGPERWLKFPGDRFAAVFGGEDDVEGVLREGVRHGGLYHVAAVVSRARYTMGQTLQLRMRCGGGYVWACVAPTALWDFLRTFPGLPAVG